VTSARTLGKGIRLVGTWDDELNLLFSQGHKNFQDKTPCNWCHLRKPMVHRYAIAKKGEVPVFSEQVFCSVACFRKRKETPNQQTSQGVARG
jgi:hypothetical protein